MADDLNYSESLARHSFYYLLDNAEESTRTGLVKENVPRQVKIDGLASYRDAVPRAFPTHPVKHVVSQGIRAEINNNLSER